MYLDNITDISSGVNQKKHPQGTVFYLQARDFVNHNTLISTLKPSVLENDKLKSHYLRKNDILVLSKGHHGFNAYVYSEDKKPAVASSIFLILRNINENISSQYLSWYLNLESTQHYLISVSRGSALPAINKKILAQLEIPIPEKSIQEKVVALSGLRKKEAMLIQKLNDLKSKELEIQLKELIQ